MFVSCSLLGFCWDFLQVGLASRLKSSVHSDADDSLGLQSSKWADNLPDGMLIY